jgi:hypothetical protein
MAEEKDNSLKSSIQKSIEAQEAAARREMARHRLELVRGGLDKLQLRQMNEAIQSFHMYIDVLEKWKAVKRGTLNPGMFDKKLDAPEMLLISGVFWELAKVYDKSKTNKKAKNYGIHKEYLRKFVDFSLGMPYEALCSEMVRKYVKAGKAKHEGDFSLAYRWFKGGKRCFIASAVEDVLDPRTIPALQVFRDHRLKTNWAGRKFVAWYYRKGPSIAMTVDGFPRSCRKIIGAFLDLVSKIV